MIFEFSTNESQDILYRYRTHTKLQVRFSVAHLQQGQRNVRLAEEVVRPDEVPRQNQHSNSVATLVLHGPRWHLVGVSRHDDAKQQQYCESSGLVFRCKV